MGVVTIILGAAVVLTLAAAAALALAGCLVRYYLIDGLPKGENREDHRVSR